MAGVPQQIDLFLSEISKAPLKDDRVLMEFPFFSLQKTPRRTPIVFTNSNVQIRVEPGPKGIATVWDKDILIYLQTIVNDQIEKGLTVSRTIQFSAYDCLKVTGRGTGKRSYELFINALFRLRSTNIVTNIQSGSQGERSGFGWIESWRVLEDVRADGRRIMKAVEVTLNDWMFRALVKDRRVLSISEEYFTLRGGLERRLYELARKHCGRQKKWMISLEKLLEKCGSTRDSRKFKADLIGIQEKQPLPDYDVILEEGQETRRKRSECTVIFSKKNFIEQSTPQTAIEVSSLALEEAKRLYPKYDIPFIFNAWETWAKGKQPAKNPDKAFLAFCQRYVTRNPLTRCG